MPNMKLIVRLAWLWVSIQPATFQCVLEKEFFCSSIPNDFPEGLTSVLFVVTNLGVINSTVFSSPSLASVTSLALANSGITSIEPGAFHAFQSLTKLSLYQNSLTNVMASWLSNPGRLENLTAAQNLIAKIGPSTFSGFSNLTTLNLASNQIDEIVGGSFKGLSKLRLIDLSSNHLTVLTRDAFSGLLMPPAMKLGGNPWNCSCELQDFGLFLQELMNSSLLEDATSVVCHSPPRLEGVQVWNISDLNCPPDIVTSAVGNSFPKVGLPTLLACLAFISFIVLLFWIWLMKHNNKQVQPSEDAGVPSIHRNPSSQAEGQQSDEKIRAMEMGMASETRMLKARANSASAILLRAEFRQEQQQNAGLLDANLTVPYVSLNDKTHDGSEDLHRFMELWNSQKPKECDEKKFQTHSDAKSFLTKVCIEKPRDKVPSEATKQKLQDNGSSGTLEKEEEVKGNNSVENSEPFLYLSVATVVEKQADAQFENDVLTKANGNHSVSLKRAFTWPYGRGILGQGSNMLNVRESFMAQYFLPTVHLDKSLDAWNPGPDEQWLHIPPRKEHQLCTNGEPELNQVAKLAKGTGPPSKSESNVKVPGESIDVKKSQVNEELQSQCDLSKCSRKDERIYGGKTKLKAEENPTNQPKCPLRKESKVAVATRCVYTSQSGIKATKCSNDVKNKQPSSPASSQSGVGHEIPPSPPPPDIALTSSPCDDNVVLLENNDNNYINLLHEVVENRGRWTRERWKQTHRIHAINQLLNKSK